MILNLNQIQSGISAAYQLVGTNSVISTANIANNVVFGSSLCYYSFLDGKQYCMGFRPFDLFGNPVKPSQDRVNVPYTICDMAGNSVGYICTKHRKLKMLRSYDYISLTFGGVEYECMDVGMGKDGVKFLIFANNQQVALIEKPCEVHNNLDQYQIFAISDYCALVAYIIGLYVDMLVYSNRGEAVIEGTTKYYSKTINKELIAMYDPGFKDYIINSIG